MTALLLIAALAAAQDVPATTEAAPTPVAVEAPASVAVEAPSPPPPSPKPKPRGLLHALGRVAAVAGMLQQAASALQSSSASANAPVETAPAVAELPK